MGDEYLLPSIAVVVVGGALITGGRGHYLGMLGGVLLLTALQTLLAGTDAALCDANHRLRVGRARRRHGPAREAHMNIRSDPMNDATPTSSPSRRACAS